MTHAEELLNAKTKDDLKEPLFELITDYAYLEGDLSLDKWLDQEKN